MSRLQSLKLFVNQRLNAAVEEIFGHFERTITEYEEEMERRHRKLLDVVLTPEIKLRHAVIPADVQQLLGSQEEVPPEQQEWSSRVEQEQPEPPHIKEEQEELWTSQEGEQLQGLEEADISKLPFPPVPVKSEEDNQSPAEENREMEPLTSSSTRYRKSNVDVDHCGGPEPTGTLDPETFLLPDTDKMSNSPEPETDDIEETRELLKSDENFKYYLRYHTGKKQFSCSACGKRFGFKGNLKRHIRIHTGEKPFTCSVCNTSFSRRHTLVEHMRTHTGEKPFSCSVCDKRFTWRNQFKSHECTGQNSMEL
ncbi:uncharacterized protein ACBR49_017364 [Aulostomus maculatus]